MARYSYGSPIGGCFNNADVAPLSANMSDRLTFFGLFHSDNTMSFGVVADAINDGSSGEVALSVRAEIWRGNVSAVFPELVRDDPQDEFFFGDGAHSTPLGASWSRGGS